jgi:hypothetical protein
MVAGFMAVLKVAVTVAVGETPVARSAGVWVVTVGAAHPRAARQVRKVTIATSVRIDLLFISYLQFQNIFERGYPLNATFPDLPRSFAQDAFYLFPLCAFSFSLSHQPSFVSHLIPLPHQGPLFVGFVEGSSTYWQYACVAFILAALISSLIWNWNYRTFPFKKMAETTMKIIVSPTVSPG